MKDKLTLMEVSRLWRESVEKYGEGGFVSAGLRAVLEEGEDGLDYVNEMGELFGRLAEEAGAVDDMYQAITDLSNFVMLVFTISIIGAAEKNSGPFAGIEGLVRKKMVVKQLEAFLTSLRDPDFARLMSVLISSSLMVGIGVGADEGLVQLNSPARGGDASEDA